MPPDKRPPNDPFEWLNRAKSNLERAKSDIRLDSVYLEDLCFDAQQAAEKAIKAALIYLDIEFPYVHDITDLLTILEGKGHSISDEVREAGRLTRFAVETRYPGLSEPVTQEEYEKAKDIADTVVKWAGEILKRSHKPEDAETEQ